MDAEFLFKFLGLSFTYKKIPYELFPIWIKNNSNINWYKSLNPHECYLSMGDKGLTYIFFSHESKPTLENVLNSIVVNAITVLHYPTYERFCAEFGYNPQETFRYQEYEHMQNLTKQLQEMFTTKQIDLLDELFQG